MERIPSLRSFKEEYSRRFYLEHTITTGDTGLGMHHHDYDEILYCLSSNIRYLVNGRIIEAAPRTLLLFGRNDFHKSIVDEGVPYERYVLWFDPSYLEIWPEKDELLALFDPSPMENTPNDDPEHRIRRLNEYQHAHMIALFNRMEHYRSSRDFGAASSLRLGFLEMLIFLGGIREMDEPRDQQGEHGREARKDQIEEGSVSRSYKKIETIMGYIDDSLQEDLSLDSLAARFYISKSHLCAVFKEAAGISVNGYIIHRRLFRSRELLLEDKSVSETAEAVGFNSVTHFIRTFSRQMGVSPGQYARGRRLSEQQQSEEY
jgi:AraC-like DNA-binding protein